jgi:hypothetical protein
MGKRHFKQKALADNNPGGFLSLKIYPVPFLILISNRSALVISIRGNGVEL